MKAVIETFRPVKGYEGLYEVSDYGCVRSLKFGKAKYMKNAKLPTGYERIDLCRNGKKKQFSIHRLVWEAFNGTIPDGKEIDHINTVRDDNRLSNLRVVTHKGNSNNPITAERNREAVKRLVKDPKWLEAKRETGRRLAKDPKWLEVNREATRKSHNKPVLQLDKVTSEVIRGWECAADVERELGINQRNISACCLGKRKSTGGFKWKFA